jgi:hypothetical protein
MPPERERRVRPNKKYATPQEMWEWHWVRMRVTICWALIGAFVMIAGSVGLEFCREFL